MIKLIQCVTHPELCEQIVGQFAFMKAMARPEDSNFAQLQELDLNDVFNKADEYFVQFTSIEEMIEADECDLTGKIELFLSEWKSITDVTAIQQNIHHQLSILDK